jgi:hypothetical protein
VSRLEIPTHLSLTPFDAPALAYLQGFQTKAR